MLSFHNFTPNDTHFAFSIKIFQRNHKNVGKKNANRSKNYKKKKKKRKEKQLLKLPGFSAISHPMTSNQLFKKLWFVGQYKYIDILQFIIAEN